MTEMHFRAYLKDQGKGIGKYYISGKVLGLNAVNDIVKWGKWVERNFDLNLDRVVVSTEETQMLLRKISKSHEFSDKLKRKFSGAIKAYFEFINGYELT